MNYRDYKNFLPGNYYHLYNRGNGKMDIFKDDQDYFNFLKRVKLALGQTDGLQQTSLQIRIQPLPENAFSIVCYCLMSNHFHFLIKQNSSVPISTFISKVCSSYSKYFNKKYENVGHLFQDQFKAVHVGSDDYLIWLSAYIHQNPKVAGIADLENYKWSSYLDYIDSSKGGILLNCNKDVVLDKFKSCDEYKNYISDNYEVIKSRKFSDKSDLILDS